MPKRMSERQLAANRRNAQRSTGPRTAKGREVSRMNALKHGILSRQVLVAGQHYQEDRKEFETLHQRSSRVNTANRESKPSAFSTSTPPSSTSAVSPNGKNSKALA